MEAFLRELNAFYPALEKAGGRSCVHFAKQAQSGGGGLREAGILGDICWEKIHTGHWKDVDVAWRDAYALSQILLVECTLRSRVDEGSVLPKDAVLDIATSVNEGSGCGVSRKRRSVEPHAPDANICAEEIKSLLRKLDMAAMMGGPRFRDFVHAKVECLQGMFSEKLALRKKAKPDDFAAEQFTVGESVDHLPLPLGSLGSKTANPCVEHIPSLENFFTEYMQRDVPCVVDGIVQSWPAFTKWKGPDYFKNLHGARTIPVEVGRHYLAPGWKQELVTFSEFIESYITPQAASAAKQPSCGQQTPEGEGIGYLAQHPLFDQIPDLKKDIRTPEYCLLGEGEIQSVNAWFGPPFTTTPLHFDPHHNLLAQVVGRKYVRLYSPKCSEVLQPFQDEMRKNSSQIDLDREAVEMDHIDCILKPGQMLYIPPKWWHYVKALDVSFSVSFWWK